MAIQPGYLQYIMTKGAIEQMTRGLARDPSIGGPDRRITVNAIAPGATGTELFYQGKSEEMLNRISGLMPQQRIGKPEEVSRIVMWSCATSADPGLSSSGCRSDNLVAHASFKVDHWTDDSR